MILRVVLKQANERRRIGGLSVREDWLFTAERRGDAGRQTPFEMEFRAADSDLKVTYVEDVISDCAYVVLDGDDAAKGAAVIEQALEFWSDEELIGAWSTASDADSKMATILKLGVGAPASPQEDFERALLAALSDPDAKVREAAIVATSYREWPSLDAKLKVIAQSDADKRCRNRAAAALAAVHVQR